MRLRIARFLIAIALSVDIGNKSAESLNELFVRRADGDESISKLIAQGAELNQIDKDGTTSLTIDSIFCRPKTAKLLLNAWGRYK